MTGSDGWIADAVQRLVRAEKLSLDSYLVTVEEATVLAGTSTTCRCHFVRVDAQSKPRVSALIDMLTDQIVNYCIPRSRIEEARKYQEKTKSPDKTLRLFREAKELFTKTKFTGEGGELLLYALLEIVLGLPQILCKMPLKTSSQVHVHGVDGVHARALTNGRLAVYWGEAKMYADVNSAIDAALRSLAPYLLDTQGGAAQREILLLRDHVDTGDDQLTAALIRYFTEDKMEASQLVIRGACLIGFSMDRYVHPIEDDGTSVRTEVADALARWHDRLGEVIQKKQLSAIELEVFFVPFPSVKEFREQFLKRLG
ncbi:MAG: HamA C-terminal domain-containing protein [Ferrimicrobium sp.]